jgi:hypothetical protein
MKQYALSATSPTQPAPTRQKPSWLASHDIFGRPVTPLAAPLRSFPSDIAAIAQGTGQGIVNMGSGFERLLGEGLNKVGATGVGNFLVNDANAAIKKAANIIAPYKAEHPNLVATGNIISSLPVGGVAGKGVALSAKALSASSKFAPLVAALQSGGFTTGLIPKGAALFGKNAPSLGARLADYGLRATGGAVTGAAGATAINPDEGGSGAMLGAALPVGLGAAGSVVRRTVKSLIPPAGAKAAEMMKKSLGSDYQRALDVMRNAAPGVTARQALVDAGIEPDVFMALGQSVESGVGGPVFRKIKEAQEFLQKEALAKAAGGETATGVRASTQEAKQSLTQKTSPMREEALTNANLGGVVPELEAQANAARTAAAENVGTVRRFGPKAQQLANDREILGGGPRLEHTYEPVGPGIERQVSTPNGITQEDLNRSSGLAGLAEDRIGKAAKASLEAGAEARTAEQKIANLDAAGIRPLNIEKVTSTLGNMANAPGTRADLVQRKTLTSLSSHLKDLAYRNGGIIDARDLYQVRKTGVNDIISKLLEKTEPSGRSARAADLLSKIKPMIDDAIEQAGGKNWRDYLNTYSSGAKELERKQLAELAQRFYKESPDKYAKLIRGEMPEEIEKIFGPGKFDIKELIGPEIGPSRLPAFEKVAKGVERNQRINELSDSGQYLASQIANKSLGAGKKIALALSRIVAPRLYNATDALKSIMELHLNPKVQEKLIEGFKSGKGAAELLDSVPQAQKASVAKALANAPRDRASLATALGVYTKKENQ